MDRLTQIFAQLVVDLPKTSANSGRIQTIYNIVLAIMGAVAVLIIVIGGFKYIVSQGNPQDIAAAKNTIIYALVGLLVIIAAFAIVNFVIQGVG